MVMDYLCTYSGLVCVGCAVGGCEKEKRNESQNRGQYF